MSPIVREHPRARGRVVLAGGRGFLGTVLAEALDREGYGVVVLTRRPALWTGPGRAVFWDGRRAEASWGACLEGAAALVNLAGGSVIAGLTRRQRQEGLQSRIEACDALGEALRQVYRPPAVWIQASSLAIYGNAGDRLCGEDAFVPDSTPSEVCVAWEEALGRALRPEMRWVVFRMGWVLGRQGGCLPVLRRMAQCGWGGRLGTGRQWISWIHQEDMTRLFLAAMQNPALQGICNATGLQPVTYAEFMTHLRRLLNVPGGLSTPAWVLRAASRLLGGDADWALQSLRCLPCRVHSLGFRFRFHDLETALADLLSSDACEEKRRRRLRSCAG